MYVDTTRGTACCIYKFRRNLAAHTLTFTFAQHGTHPSWITYNPIRNEWKQRKTNMCLSSLLDICSQQITDAFRLLAHAIYTTHILFTPPNDEHSSDLISHTLSKSCFVLRSSSRSSNDVAEAVAITYRPVRCAYTFTSICSDPFGNTPSVMQPFYDGR